MSEDTTYPIPTHTGADGTVYASTLFTPVDDKRRPSITVPPWTVVPVVFVPGIMGSNLKAKRKIVLPGGGYIKAGKRVWDVSTLLSPRHWWGKAPAYRQAVFDHNTVEVDNGGLINVSNAGYEDKVVGGKTTRVPVGETRHSRLHIDEARKRGWGSVSWLTYGDFLDSLQYQLSDGALLDGRPNAVFERFMRLVGTTPHNAKAAPAALTEPEVKKMLDIHFPVYAAGYNWLQSNMDSGKDLVSGTHETGPGHVMGIDEIIARYDGVNGQTCKQVIVVTHSMGGLVARAAALAQHAEGKILGIVHGVQPIDGAAKFYKDMAAGFTGDPSGIAGWAASHILGRTARDTIPELAYNPGPLELAPNKRYNGGKPWLFIKDSSGRVLKALPESGDPYKEIYLDTTHVWRAVNPAWLNPAGKAGNDAVIEYRLTVRKAETYHEQLGGKLHPRTYAHWGADPDKTSWGSMTWSASTTGNLFAGNPTQWALPTPVTDAGSERDVSNATGQTLTMTVNDPTDPGDGTVPAAASGAQIANYPGCLVACSLTGFVHQGDYDNATVREVVLDALVRLVEPVTVDAA